MARAFWNGPMKIGKMTNLKKYLPISTIFESNWEKFKCASKTLPAKCRENWLKFSIGCEIFIFRIQNCEKSPLQGQWAVKTIQKWLCYFTVGPTEKTGDNNNNNRHWQNYCLPVLPARRRASSTAQRITLFVLNSSNSIVLFGTQFQLFKITSLRSFLKSSISHCTPTDRLELNSTQLVVSWPQPDQSRITVGDGRPEQRKTICVIPRQLLSVGSRRD